MTMITAAGIAAVCLFFYIGLEFITQVVSVKAVTENAVGNEDAVTEAVKVPCNYAFTIGKEYRLKIQFDIIEKKGSSLFTKNSKETENRANFGCSVLEMEQVFTARKKNIMVEINLTALPEDIKDSNGQIFHIGEQKLSPVIRVEEL